MTCCSMRETIGGMPFLPSFAALRRVGRFLLVLLAAAWQGAAAQEGVRYRVELEVPGAHRALLEDNLDVFKWRGNENVDIAFLRRLHARTPEQIAGLLATEGYFAPRVEAALARDGDVWVARYEVALGEPVRVAAIDIGFTGHLAQPSPQAEARRQRLRELWPLAPGSVFRQADWEAGKRALLRALVVERYPAAQLADSRATVDPKAGTARLQLTVDSGPLFTVGELQIEGLERYPQSIVRDLNTMRPGSHYDQAQILALQTRLQDSGYFRRAQVQVEVDPARPDSVPIRVSVEENPAKRLGFGVGYSTDTGPRGRAEYSDLNVRERGWRARTGLEVDEVTQSVSGALDFPLRPNGVRDSLSGSFTHRDLEGEITDTTRVGVSRTEQVGRFERVLTLQYLYEMQSVAGAQTDSRRALTLNSSWTRRAVDNLLYPGRGYLLNFQLGGAHEDVLADRSFVRVYTKGARYYSLGERSSLMFRAEVGAVEAESRQGIPSDYLFRAGGDQSVRGYAYQTLGVQEGDAVVGGRYLAVVSAEYVFWFLPKWGAALFYDRGDAADAVADLDPVAGYGLGGRWRSPVGPINLDLAYGEETERYRLHAAVGFVF